MCCPSLFRPVVLHARWRRQEPVCTLSWHLRPPSFSQHREMCHRLKYKCRYLALATRGPRIILRRALLRRRCRQDGLLWDEQTEDKRERRWTIPPRPARNKKIRHGCRQGMLPRGATESSGERARDEGRVQGEAMSGFRNAALRQRQCARSRTNQNKAVAMTEPC